MGRRCAPYKRFGPWAQNLGAGGIHFRRACEINPGSPRKLCFLGELGDVAQYLGMDAFFNLK